MSIETIELEAFRARMREQGVAPRDVAFICPACKTVQSPRLLRRAGVDADDIERFIAFSCVGRFSGAGAVGCAWSLGGLFQIHEVEVLMPRDGEGPPQTVQTTRRSFRLATTADAHALRDALDAYDVAREQGQAVALPSIKAGPR